MSKWRAEQAARITAGFGSMEARIIYRGKLEGLATKMDYDRGFEKMNEGYKHLILEDQYALRNHTEPYRGTFPEIDDLKEQAQIHYEAGDELTSKLLREEIRTILRFKRFAAAMNLWTREDAKTKRVLVTRNNQRGACDVCAKEITLGEMIYSNRRERTRIHELCYERIAKTKTEAYSEIGV
jgi:hypothetical protein